MSVYTDRTKQVNLIAASLRADRDSTYTVACKRSDKTFVTLAATQIFSVRDAVGDVVQACYAQESVLLAALANGTYIDAIRQEGWPT